MRSEGCRSWSSVCLSVCLSVRSTNLRPQATRRQKSDTNGLMLRGHGAFFLYGVKHERKSQYANNLSSPPTTFAHFQDQRSTATT